jgi:hypothetical protein
LPFVAKLTSGGFAVEFPLDLDAVAVHASVPGFRLSAQSFEITDSPVAQTLTREDPNFDLRLIEPTAMRVVPFPKFVLPGKESVSA